MKLKLRTPSVSVWNRPGARPNTIRMAPGQHGDYDLFGVDHTTRITLPPVRRTRAGVALRSVRVQAEMFRFAVLRACRNGRY